MLAVIYQSYLKAGREAEYKKLWHQIASYFIEHRGAIGSCLHQGENSLWLAYSRWPDKATRDASWPKDNAPSDEMPEEIRLAISSLKDCLDQERKLPEICMEVVDDLLIPPPSTQVHTTHASKKAVKASLVKMIKEHKKTLDELK